MEQKRKILNSKRWCHVLKVIEETVETAPLESIVHEDKLLIVMALIRHIGSSHDFDDYGWLEFEIAVKKGRDHLTIQLWTLVREHLSVSMVHHGPVTQLDDDKIEDAKEIIKLLGFDRDKLWAEACEAVPEPRSWSKAKAKPKAKK